MADTQFTQNLEEANRSSFSFTPAFAPAQVAYRQLGKPFSEATRAAQEFTSEGDTCQYWIGAPDFADIKTLVFLVEAARNLCGMRYDKVRELLDLARECLDQSSDGRNDG